METIIDTIKRCCIIFVASVMIGCSIPVSEALALNDATMEKFSASDIIFYDPEDGACDSETKLSGTCGGDIESEGNVERTKEVVSKYGEVAINLQIEYGVPWEFVFAQMVAESSVGTAPNGVNVPIYDELGGYNWVGHHGPDPVNGSCPNTAGAYSMNVSWGPNSNNHCFRVYASIADMIGGHMFDFLRNGLYDDLLRNSAYDNWDLEKAGLSYVCMYVQGQSLSNCNTSKASGYWSTMKEYIEVADEVAAEKGWKTSEELAKANKQPAGGKHSTLGDITDELEKHSMHYDCSGAGGGNAIGGSNMTVLGDKTIRTIKDKQDGLSSKLPNAVFQTKDGLALKDNKDKSEDSVKDIVKLLDSSDNEDDHLASNVVMAVGLGIQAKNFSDSDISDIVDEIGTDKTIILITYYNSKSPGDYDKVNEYILSLASANENIKVADWAEAASSDETLVGPDGYTPADGNGVKKFSELIMSAAGVSLYNNTQKKDSCECGDKDSSGAVSGGLTEDQAQKIIDYYQEDSTDSKYEITIKKANCVNMSGFFVQLFTSGTWNVYAGNGKEVVHYFKTYYNPDIEVGSEVRPFSIFSVTSGVTVCDDGYLCGHTGIVVAVNGDDVLTLEAAYNNPDWTGFHHRTKDYFVNDQYPQEKFAYLDSIMDWSALTSIIGGSVNTTSSNSTLVDTTWEDGMLSSGIEGVNKLLATESDYDIGDASHTHSYTTNKPNGTIGANKITLFTTETKEDSDVLKSYVDDKKLYAPHFTIDIKNLKIYQHFPIDKPATALSGDDNLTGGIQIGIIGFSDSKSSGYDADWDITSDSFGDTEWAYLAMLVEAICDITGISKNSTQDWKEPKRLNSKDFTAATGILGGMHAPSLLNGPGDIWEKLNTQLAKLGTTGDCGDGDKTLGEFVWYNQCDDRWADTAFGNSTICSGGCGPTSFAMMISMLLNREILPPEVSIKEIRGYDEDGNEYGSVEDLSRILIDKMYSSELEYEGSLGSAYNYDSSIESIINEKLKSGWMIQVSGRGTSPFTAGGHFIGIRGITSSGKWLIADSSGAGEENSQKEWDPVEFMNAGIEGTVWAFRRK